MPFKNSINVEVLIFIPGTIHFYQMFKFYLTVQSFFKKGFFKNNFIGYLCFCEQMAYCQSWFWSRRSGTCRLLRSEAGGTAPLPGAVAGPKGCLLPPSPPKAEDPEATTTFGNVAKTEPYEEEDTTVQPPSNIEIEDGIEVVEIVQSMH
jgi:hypothetical protein